MPIIVKTTHGKPFRRAGRKFGPEPLTIQDGELSALQMDAIKNEPMLSVTVVAVEADDSQKTRKKQA